MSASSGFYPVMRASCQTQLAGFAGIGEGFLPLAVQARHKGSTGFAQPETRSRQGAGAVRVRAAPRQSAATGREAIPISPRICYKGAVDKARQTADILRRGHWVFDLDGTLTVAIHDFARIREVLGVPQGGDILGHLAALPAAEALVLKERLGEIEDELAGRTEAADGALGLVALLHARGVRMGVLTRNTRENALRTLGRIGLSHYIAEPDVLGRDEALAKPDPDGIFKLAQKWGASPSALVMVGDYGFDLQTGRLAGAATIHVDPTRTFRWPELTDIAVGSLAELALALPQAVRLRPDSPVRGR
jgi:phosphoglycolate phosphatase-like HAD superfamily hydrolase